MSLATQWMGIWNEAQEIPARLSRKSYTVATNDSIEVCLLPPVLHLLAQRNPEVDVRMLSLHSAEAASLYGAGTGGHCVYFRRPVFEKY